MTDELNIIYGERGSGRSQFLIDISIALKEYGLKVFFIGATSEFSELRSLKKERLFLTYVCWLLWIYFE